MVLKKRERKNPLVTRFDSNKIGTRTVTWIRIKLIWDPDPAILIDRHQDPNTVLSIVLDDN